MYHIVDVKLCFTGRTADKMKRGFDILMEYDVDTNTMDDRGFTPLRQLFECFRMTRSPQTSLEDSENTLNKEEVLIGMLRHLLSRGADPNLGRHGEEPLLINVINSGIVEGVTLLINAGADVSASTKSSGRTPVKELCTKTGVCIKCFKNFTQYCLLVVTFNYVSCFIQLEKYILYSPSNMSYNCSVSYKVIVYIRF